MWYMINAAVFFVMGYVIAWYINKPEPKPFEFTYKCPVPGCGLSEIKSTDPGLLLTAVKFHEDHHKEVL